MIRISIAGWFILFCLLIALAISSDIKARPVYLGQTNMLIGINLEIE